VFGECVSEHNREERQYADRKHRYLAARDVANPTFAFSDQPAGAEKRIAKAQADAAKDRKRRQPADLTAGYSPFVNCSPSTRAPTVIPCMNVASRDPPAKLKSQIHRSRCVW